MYDIILKWGLETLSGLVRDKDPQHLNLLSEAARLRNAMVLKRFEYAWNVCEEHTAFLAGLEEELRSFESEARNESVDETLEALFRRIHLKHIRRFRVLRSRFDATNDLFVAYSLALLQMLRWSNLKPILVELKEGEPHLADIVRHYFFIWSTTIDIMHALVRLTANDLRFWLSDYSYLQRAHEQAALDGKMLDAVIRGHHSSSKGTWQLSLESERGLESFWSRSPHNHL